MIVKRGTSLNSTVRNYILHVLAIHIEIHVTLKMVNAPDDHVVSITYTFREQ